VAAEEPEIVKLAEWRPSRDRRQDIRRIVIRRWDILQRGDTPIDFARFKPGDWR
jgi:hypothetical protein